MPLLVSVKVLSRQDLSTKLLSDWRIVSTSDKVANHLDILGLLTGIKDHRFDKHEPLALTEDLPLSAQMGNAQFSRFTFAEVADDVLAFGLYIKLVLLEALMQSTVSQLQPEKLQVDAFQVSSRINLQTFQHKFTL